MNFYPIWPVIYAWSNSTGQISNLTGHEILVKLGGNSLYASLVKLGIIPMNSTGIYLNGFTPNLTGWIWLVKFQIRPGIKYWSNWLEIYWEYIVCLPGWFGCKFIEITLHAWSNLVVIISMDLLPIWPVEFQIRPGIKYWSNWVEIHWDYIVCLPGQIGYHLYGFTPNLTSIPCPVKFDWSNSTGHEILVKMGVKLLRLHLYACLYIVWLPGQIWWS